VIRNLEYCFIKELISENYSTCIPIQ